MIVDEDTRSFAFDFVWKPDCCYLVAKSISASDSDQSNCIFTIITRDYGDLNLGKVAVNGSTKDGWGMYRQRIRIAASKTPDCSLIIISWISEHLLILSLYFLFGVVSQGWFIITQFHTVIVVL